MSSRRQESVLGPEAVPTVPVGVVGGKRPVVVYVVVHPLAEVLVSGEGRRLRGSHLARLHRYSIGGNDKPP